MNLSLLDPAVLTQDVPESLVSRLKSGQSTCIKFNRRGDLLASGRSDGKIVIFDLDTNGVARKLNGHVKQVQSLSWSRCGRYLLSASQDWKCILWDLLDGSRLRTIRFEAAVFIAELHPYNHLLFVAALFEDQPVLVDVSGPEAVKRSLTSAPLRSRAERDQATEKQLAADAKQVTTVTIFSTCGNRVLTGTNKGWFNVVDTASCETLCSTRISSSIILLLRLTGSGKDLVINSSDRVIRTYKLPDLDRTDMEFDNFRLGNEQKYQDVVNRLSWNHVTFSSTGEYVVASIYMNHYLYVWESDQGSLQTILEGPREEISVVEWHPNRPFLAACGIESGSIYVWSVVAPQKWSALAPDFAEVEENVEYVEREDEFDVHPIEEIHKRTLYQEDEEIDVLGIDDETSLGDVEDRAFQMPVLLDIEDSDSDDDVVAIGAGQYRRKSPGQGKDFGVEEETVPGSGDERSVKRSNVSPTPKRRRAEG